MVRNVISHDILFSVIIALSIVNLVALYQVSRMFVQLKELVRVLIILDGKTRKYMDEGEG